MFTQTIAILSGAEIKRNQRQSFIVQYDIKHIEIVTAIVIQMTLCKNSLWEKFCTSTTYLTHIKVKINARKSKYHRYLVNRYIDINNITLKFNTQYVHWVPKDKCYLK